MAEAKHMKPAEDPAVKELSSFSPDVIREQVDTIIHSPPFRNAPALQRLLQYVTFKTIEGQHEQLKEYTIGVEALERGGNYDPKIDTVVRVEMHRLRQKLKEYYETVGAGDPIIIVIPKGHYYTVFKSRGTAGPDVQNGEDVGQTQNPDADLDSESEDSSDPRNQSSPWHLGAFLSSRMGMGIAATVLLVSGILIGAFWAPNGIGSKSTAADRQVELPRLAPPDPVHKFWKSFLGSDTHPVLGFAQAVFLIDKTNDLLRFRHGASDNRGASVDPHLAQQYASNPALVARAGPLYYESGYTGVGDLEGMAKLTQLLTEMRYFVTVERCRVVSVDDLRSHNVILLGSSFQNDAVSQLPQVGDFVYKIPSSGNELWNGEILDLHPLAGEAASYRTERDPATGVVKADYGLITVEPGIVPGRYIANLGALDTSGTNGVARFMTSESEVSKLIARLRSLGVTVGQSRPPLFQALVKVTLENGLDVLSVRLLAVHLIHLNDGEGAASLPPTRPTPKGH